MTIQALPSNAQAIRLIPLRLAAIPGVTLDIVVNDAYQPLLPINSPFNASNTKPLQKLPPRAPQGNDKTFYSTTRRNPAGSHVEEAIENYTHIEKPFIITSQSAPHAIIENQKFDHFSRSNKTSMRAPQDLTVQASTIMFWSKKAGDGDKIVQVVMGDIHRNGQEVPQDIQVVIDWYLKAVSQGSDIAESRLQKLYLNESGVIQECLTAINCYRVIADLGSVTAQPVDYDKAMYWYQKSANQRYCSAMANIGYLYAHGVGVSKNFSTGVSWFIRAANHGSEGCQFNVGTLYEEARGVAKDLSIALEWYKKSADQDYPKALTAYKRLERKTLEKEIKKKQIL
ncbi:hypothetical protein FBU30_010632 [Linnemannia zychae]|nr:hypothetical protein FBU30_010632 [Linnemannia zychae]